MRVIRTPIRAPNANAYAERVIETMRPRVPRLDAHPGAAASRSNAPDLVRARQPRPPPSRPRPGPTAGRSAGPDPRQSARRSPPRPARRAHPRVPRRRRMIESGFPIPTSSGDTERSRACSGCSAPIAISRISGGMRPLSHGWLRSRARGRGLKPPHYPALFETCVSAIVFQQLSLYSAGGVV